MIKKGYTLLLGCCLSISACSSTLKYYIPVHNEAGTAPALSKSDHIRVLVPYNYIQYREQMNQQPTRLNSALVNNITNIKVSTEDALQNLGYNVINTGLNPILDGQPTVLALLDIEPNNDIKISNDKKKNIIFTDATRDQNRKISYYYKVQLVRPKGSDNPLLNCNASTASFNLCVAPAHLTNYDIIFTGYIPYVQKPAGDSFAARGLDVQDRFASSIFYHFPNMMGEKWVYLIFDSINLDASAAAKPFTATDRNMPAPSDPK